jgi:hypothetical protein
MCDAGSAGEWASIAWMLLLLVDPTFGRALNITPNPHCGAAAPGAAASSLARLQHWHDSAPAAARLLASDHARGSGRPLPLRVSASLLIRILGADPAGPVAPEASKAASASLPSSSPGRQFWRTCRMPYRNATGTYHRKPFLHKAPGRELASRLVELPRKGRT